MLRTFANCMVPECPGRNGQGRGRLPGKDYIARRVGSQRYDAQAGAVIRQSALRYDTDAQPRAYEGED